MDWQEFLKSQGASFIESDASICFNGQMPGMITSSTLLVPLQNFGLIRAEGEDAEDFLHNQLSNDVKALSKKQAASFSNYSYSSYSTPKGRMLASFMLWPEKSYFSLMLPKSLLPSIQKRLSMYVLRSKVKLTDVSNQEILLGIQGANAEAILKATLGDEMQGVLQLAPQRWIVRAQADIAEQAWAKLCAAGAVPAGTDCWALADIRAGIPWVLPATQETLVPQMANMDLIGAVSFQKGCYPGQEIVARTHYLGKVKRRTLRVQANVPMRVGQPLYSAETQNQACGQIILAAPTGAGQWEALAAVPLASVAQGVHLDALDGTLLEFLTLPYEVVTAE